MPLDVLDMASVCMGAICSPCNGYNGCLSLVNKFAQDVHMSSQQGTRLQR